MTGLLDIGQAAYHRDEIGDRPSLSKSILHVLIERSPAHAFAAHPKLNPDFKRVDEEKFDLGNAAHSLFLEGLDSVAICPYDSWRTKAAKEDRDAARAAGLIPMLESNYVECVQMVDAIRVQTGRFELDPPLFAAGTAERTLVWEENGVLCRARLDWLHDDLTAVDDLKTTRASANPEAWSRTMFGIGAHLQVAFYLRGIAAVHGAAVAGMMDFRFVVVETSPPYAMSVVSLAPDALALADKQVDYGMKVWAKCLRNDTWPAYPTEIAYAQAPPWMEAAWLERELREVRA